MNNFCGQCGSRLDPKTGLCPKCEKKRSGKWKAVLFPMLAIIAIMCIACVSLYPKGYFSSAHFFRPHTWQEATCEDPATCKYCGETRGDALGHLAGDPFVTEDIVNAEIRTTRICENCGETLEESSEPILSFLGDGKFNFTPDQLMERFFSDLKEASPDSSKMAYTAQSAVYNGNTADEKLMYQITYGDDAIAYLYCYDQSSEMIRFQDRDKANIWCVVLRVPFEDDNSVAISLNACDSLMAASDPAFSADEREEYVNRWVSWSNDTITNEGCLLYQAKDGILYREEVVAQNDGDFFYYTAYATMDLGSLSDDSIDFDQKPAADTPNYDEAEAENRIAGTWTAKYIVVYAEDGTYTHDLETDDNDITMSFSQDHSAELSIKKFTLDEENDLGIAEAWNDCPMQWDYMYDSGDTLYYLLHTPYAAVSIPLPYDTKTEYENTINFAIADSVYLLFEKE